ncbi:DUF3606 domain-containing protein [Pedobacter agri]|uniref:DUF3606 domain-containing protein n=1 Tax=Pedobacter agri TaxID=454586 RepID=UPI0027877753|nr:DUF3606 domain-containing protein [Pedobacter agri]MDQ1142602.1 hypothetical protein [Pedobacter agri]
MEISITKSNPGNLAGRSDKLAVHRKEEMDRNALESDEDTLEAESFGATTGIINADDPDELDQWARKFQISVQDLKAAIVLHGHKILDVKKYLSI